MNQAEVILYGLQIWLTIGAVIAVVFLTVGIDRIDEDAQGAYVFRPLLVPAVLIIWPLILWRWYILESGKDAWDKRHKSPRNAHFWVAILFVVAIPSIMVAGLSLRQQWPADFTPQKIAPAETAEQEQAQ
ncbi:MAG: hypothetical protein ABJN04_13450 [Hyphomicrobiales bacterium]